MQNNSVISPDQLIDRIKSVMPASAPSDRVVVMELSPNVVRCIILRMTAFCGFRREVEYALGTVHRDLAERTGSLRRERLEALLRNIIYQMPENIRAGFAVGPWASDNFTMEGLEHFFHVGFISLNEGQENTSLPARDLLRQTLDRFPCQALHTLNLVVARADDYSRTLEIEREILYPPTQLGERLDPKTPLATIQLIPPALNQPFVLMFEEVPLGADYNAPNRGIYYWVVAQKSPFTLIVKFDQVEGDWIPTFKQDEARIHNADPNLNWSGQRSDFNIGETPSMPEEVEFSEGLPNVVIAVESTLGMHRTFAKSRGNEPDARSTDFAIVAALCETIVRRLYPIDDLRYMLLFYGSHQPKPTEFQSNSLPSVRRLDLPVEYLPLGDKPRFVLADELLREIQRNFKDRQTASKTWHKSVDEAIHFLNHQVPWDHSDRVVIWIAQSPPFEYGGSDIGSVDSIGFRGKYSLREELIMLTDAGRTNVKNVVFLITGDTSQRLLPLAQRNWLSIAGMDQERLIEITAANEADAELDIKGDSAISTAAEYNRRRIVRNLSSTLLQLPFVYDEHNPLTYLEG